jgi:virulence factor Mce-like protein
VRRNRKRSISPALAGLIALVLLTVATFLAFTKQLPFRSHYEVDAVVRNSPALRKGSLVRIAGVNVGKVTRIEAVPGAEPAARLRLRISEGGLPLHRDATLKVRPQLFFEGNFFVDLSPGSPSSPELKDGGMIPVNQTAAAVQIDQVLGTLQNDTRQDLKKLLAELSEAYGDGGATGFRRSIKFWEPAYRDSALVADATLGRNDGDLSGYLRTNARVSAALDRNEDALKSLITDLRRTGAAFSARDRQLSAAIAELPRTLRTGQPALAALNRALPPVRRLVADARPGVRSTPAAIDAQLPFLRELRGLVRPEELRGLSADLRETIPALANLNRTNIPLLDTLREGSSCQNEVILPWGEDRVGDPDFPATGRVFEEATKPLVGLAGESRSGDANGQWFRVSLTAGVFAYPDAANRFLLTDRPLVGANPPPPTTRPPLRADVPCETQEGPDLRSNPMRMPTAGMRAQRPDTEAARKQELEAVEAARERIAEEMAKTRGGKAPELSTELLDRVQVPKIDFGALGNGR